MRSLLFVPGDRPDRFDKAAGSGADAIILDLEDAVTLDRKAAARDAIADYLNRERLLPVIVRVNPLQGGMTADDLAAVLPAKPDAIMLPKAEGAASVETLIGMMGDAPCPILPIATETPAALFALGTYASVARHLCGLTWGAEDLPAAIGATAAREEDGRYTPPIETARSLTLFGAHAAGVAAIETVYPNIRDLDGLSAYAVRGRRDGFSGMMAIHPAQVPVINAAVTPTEAEITRAQRIVDAFTAHPGIGAIQIDGQMIDAPHLKSAQALLSRSGAR